MRVVLWLISFVAVASKASQQDDVENHVQKALEGLAFSEAAKAAALAGVLQVASKFDQIFASMDELVSKEKTLADKVGQFANAFRPVSNAAHELIVTMESNSVKLSRDTLPWLTDLWEDEEYHKVPLALREIQKVYKTQLPEFDKVKAKYEGLALRAKELSTEAIAFSQDTTVDKYWHKAKGGVAIVLGIGGGAVGASGALATTATAATAATAAATAATAAATAATAAATAATAATCGAAATVALTPLAIAFITGAGLSVVAGAGGAYISLNNHQFADDIIKSALLLSDVMLEIDKLMHNQTLNLIELRQKNDDVLQHTGSIEQIVETIVSDPSKSKRSEKKRVPRLLALLTETSSALVDQCRAYRFTDMAGQQAVWETLQKQARHAHAGALN